MAEDNFLVHLPCYSEITLIINMLKFPLARMEQLFQQGGFPSWEVSTSAPKSRSCVKTERRRTREATSPKTTSSRKRHKGGRVRRPQLHVCGRRTRLDASFSFYQSQRVELEVRGQNTGKMRTIKVNLKEEV